MAMPPMIRCLGVEAMASKAINGIYEYQGVVGSRPHYRQIGISGRNNLWFAVDAAEGASWVITTGVDGLKTDVAPGALGAAPDAVARSFSQGRYPWDVDGWQVCGLHSDFVRAPMMRFVPVAPDAEVVIAAPEVPEVSGTYRRTSEINGKPTYKRLSDGSEGERTGLRLFFMGGQDCWLLAEVAEGEGIKELLLRSAPTEGFFRWPWEADAHGWQLPARQTYGLIVDGEWNHTSAQVRPSSPPVRLSSSSGSELPLGLQGLYQPVGMANGRLFYQQRLKDADIARDDYEGPLCIWFAEERGQWVVSALDKLGDSSVVRARLRSRAWWPWEAHIGGCSSPWGLGALLPQTAAPPWEGSKFGFAAKVPGWEVFAGAGDAFRPLPDIVVKMDICKACRAVGMEEAQHPFLGDYELVEMLGGRPYFAQPLQEGSTQEDDATGGTLPERRFVIWYREDAEEWVITEDFRLLDDLLDSDRIGAHAADTSWTPWEVVEYWAVPNGQGGFIQDPNLRIEAIG